MVKDTVLIQHGDEPDAANVATAIGHSNQANYIETGVEVENYDDSNIEFDLTAGKLFVMSSTYDTQTPDISPVETRQNVVFVVELERRDNISLTDNAINYIYVDPQVGTQDSPQIVVNTTGSAPSAESLKVAEIDTSNDVVDNDFNRDPAASFASLDSPSTKSALPMVTALDLNGNALQDSVGSNNEFTVAGNSATLGGSVSIALGDLSNVTATGEGSGGGLNADQVDGFEADDLGTDVEESGSIIVSDATGINFTGYHSVTDDGDGTVTVDDSHNHDSRYIEESGDTFSGYLDGRAGDRIGVPTYTSESDLPAGNEGDIAYVKDTDEVYVYTA